MPAKNDDTVFQEDRGGAFAGKPRSYRNHPVARTIRRVSEKTLLRALDMPHRRVHLRDAIV